MDEMTKTAIKATLHCLTGCAIGEVLGMVIGTALGWGDIETIVLAVALAFFFGYLLTTLPLLRTGMELKKVVKVAIATDTASITSMEIIDNLIMIVIPGAMMASLTSLLFWGSLAFSLLVAFILTVPLNRWLISRGMGHAHAHHHHH